MVKRLHLWHRYHLRSREGAVEVWACRCGRTYEQPLLFDPAAYEGVA